MRSYQLNTVTYRTSAALYLAIKCLQRLAQDEGAKYPLGPDVLQYNFYVDNVMTGADTMITARGMQSQLVSLLSTAGYENGVPTILSYLAVSHQRIKKYN